MKPKPLVSLNHFTVPVVIASPPSKEHGGVALTEAVPTLGTACSDLSVASENSRSAPITTFPSYQWNSSRHEYGRLHPGLVAVAAP